MEHPPRHPHQVHLAVVWTRLVERGRVLMKVPAMTMTLNWIGAEPRK